MKQIRWMFLLLFCSYFLFGNCANKTEVTGKLLRDIDLLDTVQYYTFNYFWDGAEEMSGMARERYNENGIYPENDKHIVTTGGTGFGLMAILSGIKRGYITDEQGLARFEKIVSFLEKADRFHGVYPHWLNGETGKVKPFSLKDDGGDLVETAFLMQGLLAVHQFYADGSAKEREIAARIDKLWKEVEWDWYCNNQPVLFWHWSPNCGWEMNFPVRGF